MRVTHRRQVLQIDVEEIRHMTAPGQGDMIRLRRTTLKRTQQWLADVSGVSVRTVIRAEQGREISSENLLAICAVLQLDVAELPPLATPENHRDDVVAETEATVPLRRPTLSATVVSFLGRWRMTVHCVSAVILSAAVMSGTWFAYMMYEGRRTVAQSSYLERNDAWRTVTYLNALSETLEAPAMRPILAERFGKIYQSHFRCADASIYEIGMAWSCPQDSGHIVTREGSDGSVIVDFAPLSAKALRSIALLVPVDRDLSVTMRVAGRKTDPSDALAIGFDPRIDREAVSRLQDGDVASIVLKRKV
jgi:transcriptional regulator with XRE-family HTH domain